MSKTIVSQFGKVTENEEGNIVLTGFVFGTPEGTQERTDAELLEAAINYLQEHLIRSLSEGAVKTYRLTSNNEWALKGWEPKVVK